MATIVPSAWHAQGSHIHQRAAAALNISESKIEDIYPCTPLQEALITLSIAGSTAYVKRIVLSLWPEIDLLRFRSTIEDVVLSTPILRTRIVQCADFGFVQAVLNEPVQWSMEEGNLEGFLGKDQSKGWGLGDPLQRYSIINNSQEKRCWFVWTTHHAVYDGWSFPIMADRVSKRYNDGGLDRSLDYKDFVQHVLRSESDTHGAYWQSSLAGNLYTQFPSLPDQSYMPIVSARVELGCPPLRKVQGITRTTLLHGAWAITLREFQNTEDVIFGTIISGRNEPITGIKKLVGPTIATVPVRVKLDIGNTVQEYLEKLQTQGKEREACCQLGLHAISKLSADARRACSFQTLFVVQPGEEDHVVTNDVGVWRRVEADIGRSSYALTIQCFLNKGETRVVAAFDPAVLDTGRAQKLIERLCFIVTQIMQSDRSQLVSYLIGRVSATDLQEIWKWNAAVPSPADACIHDIISANAQHQPLAPAICAWDGELTYAQLDSLSTQLADQLVALGVKQEVLVPLCFEKSMWMAVAMLSVLKAGGAFVPLDVSQAEDRVRVILDEIKPVVTVVSQNYQPFIQQLGYHFLVPGESVMMGWDKEGHLFTASNNLLPSAAYIIFTSGSTGTPKGVVIEHQAQAPVYSLLGLN